MEKGKLNGLSRYVFLAVFKILGSRSITLVDIQSVSLPTAPLSVLHTLFNVSLNYPNLSKVPI